MIINKNSWHYRLVTAGSNKAPVNLCPYVRRLIWIILCWTGIAVFFGMMGAGLGSSIIPIIFPTFTSGIAFITASTILGSVIIAIALASITAIAMGVAISMKKYEEYKENKEIERTISGVPSKPKSIFIAWIQAKHSKICPSLEFNNDEA